MWKEEGGEPWSKREGQLERQGEDEERSDFASSKKEIEKQEYVVGGRYDKGHLVSTEI